MAKKKLTAAQKRGLAKGRAKQAARRKQKGKGTFCAVVRRGSKTTTTCYKTESSLWSGIKSRRSGGSRFDSITLYRRKNA